MTGTELKAIRTKKGLSQAGLARILHVTVTTVYRWEAGIRKIADVTAIAITSLRHQPTGKKTTRLQRTR